MINIFSQLSQMSMFVGWNKRILIPIKYDPRLDAKKVITSG
jgi:hypothetical protein